MTIKESIYSRKLQEVPNIEYLKKIQKEILIGSDDIKGYEFNLKSVIEFDTPLLQFLLSVKRYAGENKKSFEVKNIPFSGEDLLKLYNLHL